jgi:hypothetical protein
MNSRPFLALSIVLVFPALASGAGKGEVFKDWESLPGRFVSCKGPEDVPGEGWFPLPPGGAVVLFGLGTFRTAHPGEDEVVVKSGRKETRITEDRPQKFTGRYPGGKRGRVPLMARKAEKGWELAVALHLKVKVGKRTFFFLDADGNGLFTEYGIDRMRVEDEEGEEAKWVPVPAELEKGKKRHLLATRFPDTLLLCRVDERVPGHVGPHNAILNRTRAYGGHGPVGFSLAMYGAQVSHCRYMKLNTICHAEDPSKPGYTPEGSRAGENSVCGGGRSAEDSVASMIATLYHSYDYLYPDAESVCYAFEEGFYSCDIQVNAPSKFLVYPYPGQDQVHPMGKGENPSPYPEGGAKPGGTFIRFLPPSGSKYTVDSFRITDLVTGETVPALHTDPSRIPASVRAYNFKYMLRSICLFPREPLTSGHVYRAEVVVSKGKKVQRLETVFSVR